MSTANQVVPGTETVTSGYPTFNPFSSTNPMPVTLASGGLVIGTVDIDQTTPGTTNGVVVNPPTVTRQIGQVTMTGSPVQLTAGSYVLKNGVIITGKATNNATGCAVGGASVTANTGAFLYAGGSTSEGSGVNINTIYVIGTSGDIVSFLGS